MAIFFMCKEHLVSNEHKSSYSQMSRFALLLNCCSFFSCMLIYELYNLLFKIQAVSPGCIAIKTTEQVVSIHVVFKILLLNNKAPFLSFVPFRILEKTIPSTSPR